ncbi:DUF6783 domain-containing protein [uncultured Robinsoniella sp.]|uniref:DUF6783 domain-containing protein n=1 Tax=uncultured Robinsoniella sp. TaxID=904190 RepID=UPI00374E367B
MRGKYTAKCSVQMAGNFQTALDILLPIICCKFSFCPLLSTNIDISFMYRHIIIYKCIFQYFFVHYVYF